LREKGGWNYIYSKFNKDKPIMREHQQEYEILNEMFDSMPRIPNSIVFVGNSLTRDGKWSEMFQMINIRNRGIGSDCAEGVLNRIDEILDPPPAKIFFEIGLSDMARGYSTQEIINYYEKIIQISRERSPDVELYIQSVLPEREGVYSTHPFTNKDIVLLNEKLETLAKKLFCTYVNLHPYFLKNGELDSMYTYDGVHLTAKGYSVWKKEIEQYIK
jgi:lysophospholipase L1-like esterase